MDTIGQETTKIEVARPQAGDRVEVYLKFSGDTWIWNAAIVQRRYLHPMWGVEGFLCEWDSEAHGVRTIIQAWSADSSYGLSWRWPEAEAEGKAVRS